MGPESLLKLAEGLAMIGLVDPAGRNEIWPIQDRSKIGGQCQVWSLSTVNRGD